MKRFINPLQRNKWFRAPLTILVCLYFLSVPSCQKHNFNEDSVTKTFSSVKSKKIKWAGKVKDIDGNSYKKVKIGDQIWMAQNLRTSRYNDGSPIPNVTDNNEWANLEVDYVTSGAFCWYNNDPDTFEKGYGKLYNFGAVETGKLCPVGWHVPDLSEWHILCDPFVIVDTDDIDHPYITVGNELMETGTTHWIEGLGTNETGFTALPGGIRSEDTFQNIGRIGYFWSSEASYDGFASFYPIPYTENFPRTPVAGIQREIDGLSVRCVKDN